MKKFVVTLIFNILLFSVHAQNNHSSLMVNEFEKAITAPNIQLLDVRTAAEYNSGHLKKSFLADWYNQQQFKDRTQHLDRSKPLYVYCLTGIRSAAAVKQLKQKGFTNVHDLKGGLTAWNLASKPIEGVQKRNKKPV